MNLKDLRISTRLKLSFGLMATLMLLLIASAVMQMGNLRAATVDLSENWLPSVGFVGDMNTHTSDFRLSEFQHVLNTDDARMKDIEKELAAVLADFNKNRDAYLKLISSPQEQALWDQFAQDWKRYLEVHEKAIKLSRQNQNTQALSLIHI